MKMHSAASFALLLPFAIATMVRASMVADFGDDRILVGSSHDVFVGRVVKRLGNAPIDHPIPHTRFQIEVIMPIKGTVDGEIFIDQTGGYKNGIFYKANVDVVAPGKDEGMLQPGSTYLFATRSPAVNAAKAHRLIGHPNGHTPITADATLSKEKLRALADDHQRVKQLREAYRNQVIPDVFKKDARNPYPAAPKVN